MEYDAAHADDYLKNDNSNIGLDPEDNPTFIVDDIHSIISGGNIEGEINGEYWNDNNQDEPLESKPRCIGRTDMMIGFNDTNEGKEYNRKIKEIEDKLKAM